MEFWFIYLPKKIAVFMLSFRQITTGNYTDVRWSGKRDQNMHLYPAADTQYLPQNLGVSNCSVSASY